MILIELTRDFGQNNCCGADASFFFLLNWVKQSDAVRICSYFANFIQTFNKNHILNFMGLMAIDPKDLSFASEEIRKFKIYLMSLLEKKKNAKEVYHLAIQLYPVSKRNGN